MIKILIIEDEALAAEHLEVLLKQLSIDFITQQKITTVHHAVKWLKDNPRPDLIFMDIQLADGICFEIFSKTNVVTPVIFTTAYDQYALKAFKVNSIDYLLKPINKTELNNALEKYYSLKISKEPEPTRLTKERIQDLIQAMNPEYKQRFVIKIGDHLKSIESTEILYFTSIQKLTYLFIDSGRKYMIDYSLLELEDIIDPSKFFRINRQNIIALRSITDIISFSNSRLKVQVQSADIPMVVSRDRVAAFKEWLDK